MLKKIITISVTFIAAFAVIAMTAEAEDAWLQVLVSFGSFAVLYACYKILDKMGVFNDLKS